MKILLLFPMADRQTGPAIKYAFEKLGHEVEGVDAKRMPLTSYSVACGFKPDLVFCSRTKELTEQVAQIKRKFPNAIACVWNVDTRTDINDWHYLFELIKTCDYYFVVGWRTIPQWRMINRNTFWLPQGLQSEIYDKPKEITETDRVRYACDVCWAGTRTGIHRGREVFLAIVEAMDVDFKQRGCLGIPRLYNEEHNKMAALSRINLACSGWPENERYTSVRNYKLMGAGGFVLELERKGLHESFPLDTIDCYKSPEDLAEKIRYWLAHDKERKEIAERGYKWVHANATYTDRMRETLNQMGMKS